MPVVPCTGAKSSPHKDDIMLRHKNSIRLTPKERRTFASITCDGRPAPTTVEDYNTLLESAARMWETGDSAEEQLAGLLARDLKEVPTPASEDAAQAAPTTESPTPPR